MKEKLRPLLVSARKVQRKIQRKLYGDKYMETIFTKFHDDNHWHDEESKSGQGSNMEQTAKIRSELPKILKKYKLHSMLDIPCGDFYWMKEIVNNVNKYIGAEIVEDLVENNEKKYGSKNIKFVKLDMTNDRLPNVDLIFCRDVLVHFSYSDVNKALLNFKSSKSKYLLTTNFPNTKKNLDIETGGWRPINLTKAPFNLPVPLYELNEECTQDNGKFKDKSLALWKLESI